MIENILLIGFDLSELSTINTYKDTFTFYSVNLKLFSELMPAKEFFAYIDSIVSLADAVILNINNNPTIDEILITYLAYTKNTKVFLVGVADDSYLLNLIALNSFDSLDDALDHLATFYAV